MRAIVLCLLLLVMLASSVLRIAAAVKPDPLDKSLLSLVFPGMDADGNAHKSVVIRGLTNDDVSAPLAGDMSVNVFHSIAVSNGSHSDRLLIIDVTHRDDTAHEWGGETLLALFRLSPKPRLLDVVDVRADRETYFWKMVRAPQHDAVIVNATHLNAGEEYVILDLVEIKADKFIESKVNFPMIYNADTGSSSIKEMPTLLPLKNRKAPGYAFMVKVKAQTKDADASEIKKKQSKTFSADLRLAKGRWQCPGCGSMQKGVAEMENHFGFGRE